MSDNMETVAKEGGDLGEPTQQSSQQHAAQSSPVDAKALVEALQTNDEFLAAVASKMRSVHDKRTVQHEKQLRGIEDTLARLNALKEDGFSEKQAITIMKLQDERLIEEPEPEPAKPASTASREGTQRTATSVSDLTIESYANFLGVDPKSADYVELVRTATGKEELLQKVYDLSERRKQSSTASAGGVMPTGQGAAPEKMDADTIAARLEELYKYPSKNKAEIERLSAEFDKLVPRQ